MKQHRLRGLLAMALGIVALLALSSSPTVASAATHWNVSSTLAHWKGSLTVEVAGYSPVSCSNLDMRVTTGNDQFNSGYAKLVGEAGSGVMTIPCAGGTSLQLYHLGEAVFNGTNYQLNIRGATPSALKTPFPEEYFPPGWLATGIVTNGSGLTPSQIAFSHDQIGSMEFGAAITISGTLTITTSTGGLLTLST